MSYSDYIGVRVLHEVHVVQSLRCKLWIFTVRTIHQSDDGNSLSNRWDCSLRSWKIFTEKIIRRPIQWIVSTLGDLGRWASDDKTRRVRRATEDDLLTSRTRRKYLWTADRTASDCLTDCLRSRSDFNCFVYHFKIAACCNAHTPLQGELPLKMFTNLQILISPFTISERN